MPSLNHVHSYVHVGQLDRTLSRGEFLELWMKCDDPRCSSKNQIKLLEGKEVLCSHCHNNTLILTREALRRVKPRCLSCSHTKEARRVKKLREIMKMQGVNLDEVEEMRES